MDTWGRDSTKRGTRYAFSKPNRPQVVHEFTDTAVLSCVVHSRRVNADSQAHVNICSIVLRRIFELALAFDALRLRNIIQLLSIIGRWS